MQAFIDFIVKNLLKLWPIARVDEWETGILVRAGIIQHVLKPGLHWRWLFLDEVITWWSSEMSAALATGCVVCASGEPVIVSANIRYRITDYVTTKRAIFDLQATLKRNLVGLLCTEVAARSWADLSSDRRKLEAELKAIVNETAKAWGLLVTDINLTDLVQTMPIHHTSDGSFFVQGSVNT